VSSARGVSKMVDELYAYVVTPQGVVFGVSSKGSKSNLVNAPLFNYTYCVS